MITSIAVPAAIMVVTFSTDAGVLCSAHCVVQVTQTSIVTVAAADTLVSGRTHDAARQGVMYQQ
jgi:hypothetical protein